MKYKPRDLQFFPKRGKKASAFRDTAFRNTLVIGLESLAGHCWQNKQAEGKLI